MIGLVVLAAVMGWVARMTGRVAPERFAPDRILRLGVLGGLAFAAFHGAVDHGIQIPAKCLLVFPLDRDHTY